MAGLTFSKEEIDRIVGESPVVESYRQLGKFNAFQTMEYGIKAIADALIKHEASSIKTLTERFGEDKAMEVYRDIWRRVPTSDREQLRAVLGVAEELDGDRMKEIAVSYAANPTPEKILENYQKAMSSDPRLSIEYGVHVLLDSYMKVDISMFRAFEAAFGTETGVDLYATIWSRFSAGDFEALKAMAGVKGEVGIPELLVMSKVYFEDFGNPFVIVHSSEEKGIGQGLRCPYTELAWRAYSVDEANDFNDKVQDACNTTIYRSFLEKAGLGGSFEIKFNKQLCRGDDHCEWALQKIKRDRSASYREYILKRLARWEQEQGRG